MATMTTKDNFPVIDVTHKPKRMQGTNLRTMNTNPVTTTQMAETDVPQSATLERAIVYYETHAEGEFKVLYSQTAKWLREYMSKTVPVPVVDSEQAPEMSEELRGR